jgi:hypothetical protein
MTPNGNRRVTGATQPSGTLLAISSTHITRRIARDQAEAESAAKTLIGRNIERDSAHGLHDSAADWRGRKPWRQRA